MWKKNWINNHKCVNDDSINKQANCLFGIASGDANVDAAIASAVDISMVIFSPLSQCCMHLPGARLHSQHQNVLDPI